MCSETNDLSRAAPFPPEKSTEISNDRLHADSVQMLHDKGFGKNTPALADSVVKGSEQLMKGSSFRISEENGGWIFGPTECPQEVEFSEVENQLLHASIHNLPKTQQNIIIARYLEIRHALSNAGEWSDPTVPDSGRMVQNPNLAALAVTTAYERGTFGIDKTNDQAIPFQILREFAEKLPNIPEAN